MHPLQLGERVRQVLDHVPHRDDVERLVLEVDALQRAVADVEAALAGLLDGPARRLQAGDVPAGRLRDLQEHAEVAADVQQLAAALVALDGRQIAAERLDPTAALLHVPLIDHAVVGVDDLFGGRDRALVDQIAAAAPDDRAAHAVRRAGAGVHVGGDTMTVATLSGGIDLLGVPASTQVAGHAFERLGEKDL